MRSFAILRHSAPPGDNEKNKNMNDEDGDVQDLLLKLRAEHRSLDQVISQLSVDLLADQLQLQRLKKRKLQLKDFIARLESRMIPDLNA
ncbi:MAG: YdcH family protein [Acidiferrobacterales bacterium]